jgi:hypothetical protein
VSGNPEYSWNDSLLSANPNITWDIVEAHPEIKWDHTLYL